MTQQHPLLAGAGSLTAALDELTDLEPAFLPVADKREALVALARLSSRVQALHARVAAVADDVAQAEGHRDIAAWLAHRTLASATACRRMQRLGEACERRWHRLGQALVTGEVNVDQAHVIAAVLDDLACAPELTDAADDPADVLGRAEAYLIEQAEHFGPQALRRLGERLLEVIAPEIAERVEEQALADAERRARRTTTLRIQALGDGTALIRARVPESIALRLSTALEAFTNPRRTNPRRTGTGRTGTDGTDASGNTGVLGARVPYDRRLGEAFCSLLETLDPTRLPLHGGDATTLVITMDLATLTDGLGAATLADGSRISAGEARRLACTANLVPAVLGTDSIPLDLGRTSRLYPAGPRKALALRDRRCRADGCTIPATWCEAHHLAPWSTGGTTDLASGILLCAHHHHLIHDDRYLHERLPNGDIRFTLRR